MARILLLIVLVFILVQIFKRMAASADSKPSKKVEEKMLQCSNCGCHVPESESHIKNDKIICNNPECQQ
jgi:formylmethanofuran dehydrogenase subunit E